jgi:hypothetical protein
MAAANHRACGESRRPQGIRISQREVFDDRAYTFDEQLNGGKVAASAAVSLTKRAGGRWPGWYWNSPVSPAAPGWSPDAYARRSAENSRRQASRRINDMLAIVE